MTGPRDGDLLFGAHAFLAGGELAADERGFTRMKTKKGGVVRLAGLKFPVEQTTVVGSSPVALGYGRRNRSPAFFCELGQVVSSSAVWG